jgi:PAS domain S-box-containing protein
MSPPDRGQSRPDMIADEGANPAKAGVNNVPVAWPQHPLALSPAHAAGASALSTIESSLAKEAASAVFALADGKALWWNKLGATVFGLPGEAVAIGIEAALARARHSERPWLERRRLFAGRRPCGATLLFARAPLAAGGEALIVIATILSPQIQPDSRALPPPRLAASAGAPQARTAKLDATSRRLTWQTDTSGRLLAGPGASLSQALGRGAPMQPAMLSEIFAENGATVAEAVAAGRPIAGLPVMTLAAADGTVFIGSLFGAPVLDHGRRAAGYRGFLAVTGTRRAPDEETMPVFAEDGGTADPVGADFPQDELPQYEEAGSEAFSDGLAAPADAAASAAHIADGTEAAAVPMVSEIAQAQASQAQSTVGSAELAPLLQSLAPFRTASGHGETVVSMPKSIEAPSRMSNVIALRPPGSEQRHKEAETPPLSPAESDAFADIAKALGALAQPGRQAEAATLDGDRDTAGDAAKDSQGQDAEGQHAQGQDAQGLADVASTDLIAIISRLPVGVMVHRDGTAVAANRTLLDLLGYAGLAEFAAHGGIGKLFVDEERGQAEPAVAIRTRDGEVIEVDARCQAIKWHGEAATLMTMRRSLASETRALEARHQAALAQERSRIDDLEAILAGTSDGVVTVDELGRIAAMNASAERLFGYGRDEIAGEAIAVLIAPECHQAIGAELAAARTQNGRRGTADSMEITGRERQGRRLPLSMRLFLGRAGASAPVNVVFRDHSAAKSSEAGLVEARIAAERSTAQKSEFLAKVSHEIRTPLNSIVGFADIIAEERFGPLQNERYKEYVKDIRASGTHIISLVNDLLDLSKIEAGRMEMSFSNVNLNAEVGASASLVQMEAARSRVLMRQSLAQGLPPIIADARSVKQIVLNILSNAVKFTDPGGQVIASTALSDKGEVIFRVRDTGIGMSERELAEAMEPFKQFATTLRPGGSGLGLSLTKALVKANHANLSISSISREGTLVEIVFPRERVMAV